MWRQFFLSLFMLICRKICFAAIYAVLAQNLFCCDLRTFVWRKIYSEIVLVEKKGQISGMHSFSLPQHILCQFVKYRIIFCSLSICNLFIFLPFLAGNLTSMYLINVSSFAASVQLTQKGNIWSRLLADIICEQCSQMQPMRLCILLDR